ncbi:hypothetical protein GQ457_04G027230 [Hibiscus cannabinus]
MEAKGRRKTTRISNFHEGMEEPSPFSVCGCGFSAQLRTSWSIDILEGGSLVARIITIWCIVVVDISVGLILH